MQADHSVHNIFQSEDTLSTPLIKRGRPPTRRSWLLNIGVSKCHLLLLLSYWHTNCNTITVTNNRPKPNRLISREVGIHIFQNLSIACKTRNTVWDRGVCRFISVFFQTVLSSLRYWKNLITLLSSLHILWRQETVSAPGKSPQGTAECNS